MNTRLKSVLAVLGLSVVAVPTLVAARTHYSGKVPASIALAAVPTRPHALAVAPRPTVKAVAHSAASHRAAKKVVTATHKKATAKSSVTKKSTAASHQTAKKAHQRSHRKPSL